MADVGLAGGEEHTDRCKLVEKIDPSEPFLSPALRRSGVDFNGGGACEQFVAVAHFEAGHTDDKMPPSSQMRAVEIAIAGDWDNNDVAPSIKSKGPRWTVSCLYAAISRTRSFSRSFSEYMNAGASEDLIDRERASSVGILRGYEGQDLHDLLIFTCYTLPGILQISTYLQLSFCQNSHLILRTRISLLHPSLALSYFSEFGVVFASPSARSQGTVPNPGTDESLG